MNNEISSNINIPIYPIQQIEPNKIDSLFKRINRFSETRILNDKLMGHITGSYYLLDSGLEGLKSEDALEFMIKMLEDLSLNNEFYPLIDCLKKSLTYSKHITERHDINDLITLIFDAIENLNEEHPYCLIPGGWIGEALTPGHAMLYLIKKDFTSQTYSFEVINTGNGMPNFHDLSIDEEGKFRFKPSYLRKELTKEQINNKTIFKALLGLQYKALGNKNWRCPYIIYNLLVPSFGGDEEEISMSIKDYMLTQRSGTCAWKVLEAFLKLHIPHEDYKKLKIYSKFYALTNYIKSNPNQTKTNSIIISKCIEKIARLILCKNHSLTNEEEENLIKHLKELRNTFQQNDYLKIESALPSLQKKLPNIDGIINIDLKKFSESISIHQIQYPKFLFPIESREITPENFVNLLEEYFLKITNLYRNQDYRSVIFESVEFLNQLPIPTLSQESFWENHLFKNDRVSVEKMMFYIVHINEAMFNSSFLIKKAIPDAMVAALTSNNIFIKLIENLIGWKENYRLIYFGFGHNGYLTTLLDQNVFKSNPKAVQILNANKASYKIAPWSDFTSLKELIRTGYGNNFPCSEGILPFHEELQQKFQEKAILSVEEQEAYLLWDDGRYNIVPYCFAALFKQSKMIEIYFGRNEIFEQWSSYKITENQSYCNAVNNVYSHSINTLLEKFEGTFINKDYQTLIKISRDYFSFQKINNNVIKDNSLSSFPQEDARALLDIIEAKKNMQLWQTLSFYSSRWNHLNHTDAQKFMALMILNNIEPEFKLNPSSAQKIFSILENGLQELNTPSSIEGYLFVLYLCFKFYNCSRILGIIPENFTKFEQIILNKLKAKDLSNQSKNQLNVLYALFYNHSKFDTKNLEPMILAKCLMQNEKMPEWIESSSYDFELEKVLRKNALIIHEHFKSSDISPILNNCLNLIHHQSYSFEWSESEFPYYKTDDDQFTLNIITGEFFQEKGLKEKLPNEVLNHSDFKHVFKNFKPLVEITLLDDGYKQFSFIEKDQRFRLFYKHNLVLYIEKEIENNWYRYLPKEIFSNLNLPNTFKNDFNIWCAVSSNQINDYILVMKDEVPLFCVNINEDQSIQSITTYDKKESLVALDKMESQAFLAIRDFGNSDQINLWKNIEKEELSRIEFKQYGLNFDILNNKAYCVEHPGYYYSLTEDWNNDIYLNMPYLKHFIPLQNQQGNKSILICDQIFRNESKEKLVKECSSSFNNQYFFIKMNENNEPINLGINDLYFLFSLAYANSDYDLMDRCASKIIMKNEKKLNPIFFRITYSASEDKESDPKTLSLLLKICLHHAKNQKFNSEPIFLKIIESLYETYKDSAKNAARYELSHSEEKILLEILHNKVTLSKYAQKRLEYLRLKAPLKAKFKNNGKIDLEVKSLLVPNVFDGKHLEHDLHVCILQNSNLDQKSFVLEGAPNPSVSNTFLFFLSVIQNLELIDQDDQLFQNVMNQLHICSYAKEISTQFLIQSLQEILNHREIYAAHIDQFKSQQQYQWFLDLKDLVQKNKIYEKAPFRWKKDFPINFSKPITNTQLKTNKDFEDSLLIDIKEYFSITKHSTEEKQLLPLKTDNSLELVRSYIEEYNAKIEDYYANKPIRNQYSFLNNDSLKNLHKNLSDLKNYHLNKYEYLEKNILIQVNENSMSLLNEHEIHLRNLGDLEKNVTMDDLIYSLLLPAKNLYPIHIEDLIIQSLITKTKLQQIDRALIIIDEMNALHQEDPLSFDLLTNKLAEELQQKREFNPYENPSFLIYETLSELLLRKNQIEILKILEPKNGIPTEESQLVVEAIMGSGKTKVILPILALLKANGWNLPIIVVPKALYETNKDDLRLTSLKCTKQDPVTLNFDRNSPCSIDDLRTILWDIEYCIEERSYLITTAESIQCFHLKYQEFIKNLSDSREISEENIKKLKLFEQILDYFKTRGCAIFDEADSILNVSVEVNFPYGKSTQLSKDKIHTILWITQYLQKHLPKLQKNLQDTLTDSKKQELILSIATEFTLSLKESNINTIDLINFIIGKSLKKLPELMDHPQKNEIYIFKEYMTSLLPIGFAKSGNVNYGLSKQHNHKYAIPYLGNNKPDEGSQFGNVYETMLYTAFIYMQFGLTENHVQELITHKRFQAKIEPKLVATEMKDYFGVNDLYNISEDDLQKISNAVKHHPQALSLWLKEFAFSDITLYLHKLNSNAYDLVNKFNHVQGFTGYLWNHETFPSPLNKQAQKLEKFSEISVLDAINTKINWNNQLAIHPYPSDRPNDLLNFLIMHCDKYDAFIDVGASLKGISTEEVANQLIKHLASRGIIYFNNNNEIRLLTEKGEKELNLLSPECRFTYYDHIHTTGTDIKQHPKAVALMTTKNKPLRDIVQGAMRFRNLLTTQRIELLDDASSFEEIILTSLEIQAKKRAQVFLKSKKLELLNAIKSNLFEFIKKESDVKLKLFTYKFFEEFLIDISIDDPSLEFSSPYNEKNTLELLCNYKEKLISKVEITFCNLSSFSMNKREELIGLKDNIINHLKIIEIPTKNQVYPTSSVQMFGNNVTGTTIEVEREVEIEESLKCNKLEIAKYKKWLNKNSPIQDPLFFTLNSGLNFAPKFVSLNQVIMDANFQDFTPFFDENLHTSEQFITTAINPTHTLFEPNYQKIPYQIIFVKDINSPLQAFLLDPLEMGYIKKLISSTSNDLKRKIQIFDLDTRLKYHYGEPFNEEERMKLKDFITQAKFFSGSSLYRKKELKILKSWIRDKKISRKEFETIASSYPGKLKKYFNNKKLIGLFG